MTSIHNAYQSEDIFSQLSEEEKLHVHSYNIAEIIKSIAEGHAETLELVLALAGPDVAEKIDNIYKGFVESKGDKPIELGIPALKTMGKLDLAIEAAHGDSIADEMPLEQFQNMIVGKG